MKQDLIYEAINLILSDQTETAIDANRIKELINAGIDVNVQIDTKKFPLLVFDSKGLSLLHLAIIHCKPQIVEALLASNKVNLQLVNKDGQSALHMVVDYRDDTQQTIQTQIMMKEKQIAEAIIKYSNAIDLQDKDGNTALHKAAIDGNVYVVELLLKKDYLFPQQKILSIKNKRQNTVLHEVAQNGKQGIQILSLLIRIASQNDLETKNALDETPPQLVERLTKERAVLGTKLPAVLSLLSSLFKRAESLLGLGLINIHADLEGFKILSNLLKTLTSLVEPLKQLPLGIRKTLIEVTNLMQELLKTDQKLSKEIALEIDYVSLNAQQEISQFLQINNVYIQELRQIEKIFWQIDYLDWNKKIMGLPSSFSNYQKNLPSPSLTQPYVMVLSYYGRKAKEHYEIAAKKFSSQDYSYAIGQLEMSLEYFHRATYLVDAICIADVEYLLGLCYQKQVESSLNPQIYSDNYLHAQTHLIKSRDICLTLKDYVRLEKIYQVLTEIQIKQPNLAAYEKIQLAVLENRQTSNKEKLSAHFALASLYELNRRYTSSQISNPVLEQSLIAYESYHYSLAYELTQGPIDPKARLVLQREIGIGHNIKLGTTNLQQCVAVFAFEPKNKKLVLAHFDKFSGPLTFIEQLFSQFSKEAELDIYLSGGRDQSEAGKPISVNNINQVLKQLYTYKDRINIKSADLGKKPSPPAVIFDPEAKRLVHGVAQHPDISLHTRAAQMLLNLNKLEDNDYLYPLTIVDYQAVDKIRKDFTSIEKQQLTASYHHYYLQTYTQLQAYKAWYHNQILYPLLVVLNTVKEDFSKPLISHTEQLEDFQIHWDSAQNLPQLLSSKEAFGSTLDLLSMLSEQSSNDEVIPSSSNQRKRLSTSSAMEHVNNKKQRLLNTSFGESTERNDFPYWLNQKDITEIARIAFNSYQTAHAAESQFEVIGDPLLLEKQLQKFKNSLLESLQINARMTFIINLENNHWVTLVLNYRQTSWQAFYVDSKRKDLIPKVINDSLNRVLTIEKLFNLSPPRQAEGANCGLWALESASLINHFINHDLYWQGADWKKQLDKKEFNQKFFKGERKRYAALLRDGATQENISWWSLKELDNFSEPTPGCSRRKKRSTGSGQCVAMDNNSENFRKRLKLLQQAEDWINRLTSLGHLKENWLPILSNVKKLTSGGEQITLYNFSSQKEKVIQLPQQKTLQFRETLQQVYKKLHGVFRFVIRNPELFLHLILNTKNGMINELPVSVENAHTIDGLNAVFTLQALMAFFQQKNRQSLQTEHDPLSLSLEIHTYVNFAQMMHGTVIDVVKVTSVVKALLYQTRVIQKNPISVFRLQAKSVSAMTEGLGNLLGIFAVGLDIDELSKARATYERNLSAMRLASDSSSLLLSASGTVAGFLGASSAAVSLSGLGTIFSGLSIGIMGLVESYNQVEAKVDSVGEYFYQINDAYQHFGYEKMVSNSEETCYMSPYFGAVIREIDFQKGHISYGSQFIYRTHPRSRGVFGSGKVNYISWAGDKPTMWLDKKQALNIRERLGYSSQSKLESWKACKDWILPYTPVSYITYSWSSLPFATMLNYKGFSVLRELEQQKDFDYDFYVFPSEYIISEITENRATTVVKINLDRQSRSFVIPKFPKHDRELYTYIHYTFLIDSLSEGGQCQLYLSSIASIQLKEVSSVNYTWILSAEGLIDDALQFTKSGIKVGDIPIEIPQHQAKYYFIDKKATTTFYLDFTQLKLVPASINYQQVQKHSYSLQAYLQNHNQLNKMSASSPSLIFTLTHFQLHDEYGREYQGKAYYSVAEDRLLYTNKLPKNLNEGANLVHFTEDSAYFFNPELSFFWRGDNKHNLVENYVFLSEFVNKNFITCFLTSDTAPMITAENGVIQVVQTFVNAANQIQRQAVYHIARNQPPQLNGLHDDTLLMNLHLYSLLDRFNSTAEKQWDQNELQHLCSNQIFSIKLGNDSYPHLTGKAAYAELSAVIRISSLDQTLSLPALWVRQNNANNYQLINPQLEEPAIFIGSLLMSEGKEAFYFFVPPNKENLGELYRQIGKQRAILLDTQLISAFFSDKNTLLAFTKDGVVKRINELGKAYILSFTSEWINNQSQWWEAVSRYLAENPPAIANIPLHGITDQTGKALNVWYDTHDERIVIACLPLQKDGQQLRLTYLGQLGGKYFFQTENKTIYYQTSQPPLLISSFNGTQIKDPLTPLNVFTTAEQVYLQQKVWIHTNGLLFSILPQKLENWVLEKIYFQWVTKNNCINQYNDLKISLFSIVKNEAEYLKYCFHSAFLSNNESFFIPAGFSTQNITFSFSNSTLIPIEKYLNTVTHWWYPAYDLFVPVPKQKNGSEWAFLAKTVNQNHYFFSPKEKLTYVLSADTTMDSKKPYQTLSTELVLRSNNTILWLFRAPYPKLLPIPLFEGVEICEMDVALSANSYFTLCLSNKTLDHYRVIVFQASTLEAISHAIGLNNLWFDLADDDADKLFAWTSEQDIVISHTQHRCRLTLVSAMSWDPSVTQSILLQLRANETQKKRVYLLDLQNQLKATDGESISLWPSRIQRKNMKNQDELGQAMENLSTQKMIRVRRAMLNKRHASLTFNYQSASLTIEQPEAPLQQKQFNIRGINETNTYFWCVLGAGTIGLSVTTFLVTVRYLFIRQFNPSQATSTSFSAIVTGAIFSTQLLQNTAQAKEIPREDNLGFSTQLIVRNCVKTVSEIGELGICLRNRRVIFWQKSDNQATINFENYLLNRSENNHHYLDYESSGQWALDLNQINLTSFENIYHLLPLRFHRELAKQKVQQQMLAIWQQHAVITMGHYANSVLSLHTPLGNLFKTVGLSLNWQERDDMHFIGRWWIITQQLLSYQSPSKKLLSFSVGLLEVALLHPHTQSTYAHLTNNRDFSKAKTVIRFIGDLLQLGCYNFSYLARLLEFYFPNNESIWKISLGIRMVSHFYLLSNDLSYWYLGMALFVLPYLPSLLENFAIPVTRGLHTLSNHLVQLFISQSLLSQLTADEGREEQHTRELACADERTKKGGERIKWVLTTSLNSFWRAPQAAENLSQNMLPFPPVYKG
ncbi:MAG: TcdA/TcdB pore-forming domain-containing protein [Candidatus Aquirickettsiella sp.]